MHSRNFFLFLSCRIFCWLRHGILHLFWRCYLHGEISKTKLLVLTFSKNPKNASFVRQITLPRMRSQNFFWFLSRNIFCWLCRGVLQFFCRFRFCGAICKTKLSFSEFFQIIVWGHVLGEDKLLANNQKTDIFVSQITPQILHLQKIWSIPRHSQQKIPQDKTKRNAF